MYLEPGPTLNFPISPSQTSLKASQPRVAGQKQSECKVVVEVKSDGKLLI